MEKKSNSIIILMGIIIVLLSILCVLFATDTIVLKSENNTNIEENNNSETNNTQEEVKKDYSKYIGTWHNDQTQNEITIKKVTDNEITFTWFLYRIGGIDEDTTISFKDGKAIFFYQGYQDKNFDGNETEDEKYIRKATIELTDVAVKDVNEIDANYEPLDNFLGSEHIKEDTYTHPNKIK